MWKSANEGRLWLLGPERLEPMKHETVFNKPSDGRGAKRMPHAMVQSHIGAGLDVPTDAAPSRPDHQIQHGARAKRTCRPDGPARRGQRWRRGQGLCEAHVEFIGIC